MSCAADIQPLSEFTPTDRILILAPHPDDEAIGTAGVIQKALRAGAALKVVLFTNGDHNEWAFIVYEKRLTLRKKEFIHMGELRRQESLKALELLGVKREQIVFLGYPDSGTLEIITKHWGKTPPFKDFLTRINKVPYQDSFSLNAPYVGESILSDLEKVIGEFKPTKIFVSHPVDANRDHQSLYLYTRVALWDLADKIPLPQIYPYLVHIAGWPIPRRYHPDKDLGIPEHLKNIEINWVKLDLSPEEVQNKYRAINFYRTQIEYEPSYLISYARRNELFGDYPVIKLKMGQGNNINWVDVETHGIDQPADEKEVIISRLSYAFDGEVLFIKVTLKHKVDASFGISSFLLGYSKKTAFPEMPKILLKVGINGLEISDRSRIVFKMEKAGLQFKGKDLILQIPIFILGYPDYILASARSHAGDLPLGNTGWRVIELIK
jgi:LmbE family N-acetylglucosaminyl deacetylase